MNENILKHYDDIGKVTELKKDEVSVDILVPLIRNIENKRDKIIFLIAVTTGARVSEIANLDKTDVIMNNGRFYLNLTCKGRSGKQLLSIHKGLYMLIDEYLQERKDNYPALLVGESNRSKGRLKSESISRLIKAYFRNYGLDSSRITAHSLRHTFITILMKATGENLPLTMKCARHKEPNSTILYTHIDSWHNNLTEQERLDNNTCQRLWDFLKTHIKELNK